MAKITCEVPNWREEYPQEYAIAKRLPEMLMNIMDKLGEAKRAVTFIGVKFRPRLGGGREAEVRLVVVEPHYDQGDACKREVVLDTISLSDDFEILLGEKIIRQVKRDLKMMAEYLRPRASYLADLSAGIKLKAVQS